MTRRDTPRSTAPGGAAPSPWPHPASTDDDALLAQCEQRLARTGGPGGQHRNRVDSKVILTHRPTGLEAHAGERRSAVENRRVALRRLRLDLAVRVRAPVPLGEIGSELWRSRRRITRDEHGLTHAKIACSADHHDYPSLLAEALDVIAAANWDVKKAALRLEVSTTQLVKLVKDHRPAMDLVNQERQARGEHPLK